MLGCRERAQRSGKPSAAESRAQRKAERSGKPSAAEMGGGWGGLPPSTNKVIPHLKNFTHLPHLSQRPCLVTADAARTAQRLNTLKILYQDLLLGHPLGSQGEANRDSSQEPFRHIRHDYANHEDEVGHQRRLDDDAHDEEEDAEGNGNRRDDHNEVVDLVIEWVSF